MTLVDRKTLARPRRIHRRARPRRQPSHGTRDVEGTGARDLGGTSAPAPVAAPAEHPPAQAPQATRGEPKPGPTGDNGAPPSGPQRPAPPIAEQAPIRPPEVAGKMGQPTPERERQPRAFWLVLVGAIFGLAVLREFLGRVGGPVVVKVKSVPRVPGSVWIAGVIGALERIGARVLGLR